MDAKTAREIASEISGGAGIKPFTAALNPQNYSTEEITPSSIREIAQDAKAAGKSDVEMLFVDGGNGEMFGSPRASLQLLRLYGCTFRGNTRVQGERHEFYALSLTENSGGKMSYSVKAYPLADGAKIPFGTGTPEAPSFSQDDSSMKSNGSPSPSRAIDATRRFSELRLAESMARKMKPGSLVVLDGTLEASYPDEERIMEQLYSACRKNGLSVCGLSKTSGILTRDGYPLAERIFQLMRSRTAKGSSSGKGNSGGAGWVKVAESSSASHQATVLFARLHPSSRFVFRIDLWKENGLGAEKIMGMLSSCSTDISFPGYPYGLIHADRFARVPNSERQYYKTLFMARSGREWGGLLVQESSVSAHSVLDSM